MTSTRRKEATRARRSPSASSRNRADLKLTDDQLEIVAQHLAVDFLAADSEPERQVVLAAYSAKLSNRQQGDLLGLFVEWIVIHFDAIAKDGAELDSTLLYFETWKPTLLPLPERFR